MKNKNIKTKVCTINRRMKMENRKGKTLYQPLQGDEAKHLDEAKLIKLFQTVITSELFQLYIIQTCICQRGFIFIFSYSTISKSFHLLSAIQCFEIEHTKKQGLVSGKRHHSKTRTLENSDSAF